VDTAHGDRESLLLWPGGAPGALGTGPEDRPKITIYRAPAATANGTAVLVCPGGSYRTLASAHEGKDVAEWLNTLGVSAFVLQYRVGPRYHHPVPLQDAQRAIRPCARAKDFGSIRPPRESSASPRAGIWPRPRHALRRRRPDREGSHRPHGIAPRLHGARLSRDVDDAPFSHKGSIENLLGRRPIRASPKTSRTRSA
jgi:hypothetical protein